MTAISRERIIVEPDEGSGVLVMWPDGSISGYADSKAASKVIKEHGRRTVASDGVLVMEVEWRGGTAPEDAR